MWAIQATTPLGVESFLRWSTQGCSRARNPGSTRQSPVNPNGVVASIPHVPLIPLQLVFAQQGSQFVLKAQSRQKHSNVGDLGHNPVGVESFLRCLTQGCSRGSQPWALSQNPFGILGFVSFRAKTFAPHLKDDCFTRFPPRRIS